MYRTWKEFCYNLLLYYCQSLGKKFFKTISYNEHKIKEFVFLVLIPVKIKLKFYSTLLPPFLNDPYLLCQEAKFREEIKVHC